MTRVLVVDDDPGICSLVADVLAGAGYDVEMAHDGAQALERVRQQPPAAIVLDLMLPVLSGWQFAEAYQHVPMNQHAPIIVMSAAHDLDQTAERLRTSGVRAAIAKPFDLEDLIALVERYAPLERQPNGAA